MDTLLDIALPYQRDVILDQSKVKVLNFSRQIGKSWTMAFLSTLKCCQRRNALVLYLSTGQRAASEALRTCLRFAEAVKQMSYGKMDYSSNATTITYGNGSRILSLPGNPAACRGWSADLLCCDEMAFWQNPWDSWQAIVPTILNPLASHDKQVVVCSTPLGRNSLFYELCQRAKAEKDWRYFQTTIWDAKKAGLNVDVESLRKLIPDPNQFACEFECQFAEKASQLVAISDLTFVGESDPFVPDEFFMGADWARSSDGTAIVVFGRDRKSGTVRLVDSVVIHNEPYKRQIEVAKSMFQRWRPRLFYGDATGLGGPMMEQLNRECSTLIKPYVFTSTSKNAAYENFRRMVFDRKVEFDARWRDQIVEDLLLIQQIVSDDGKICYSASRRGNSHADLMSAIVLALMAERDSRPIMTDMFVPISFASSFN